MILYLVRYKYGIYIFIFFINQVCRNNCRNCDWFGFWSVFDWLLFCCDLLIYVFKVLYELFIDYWRILWRVLWGILWGLLWGILLIYVINMWCIMFGRCLWQLKLLFEFVINNFGNFEVVDGIFYFLLGCNFNIF